MKIQVLIDYRIIKSFLPSNSNPLTPRSTSIIELGPLQQALIPLLVRIPEYRERRKPSLLNDLEPLELSLQFFEPLDNGKINPNPSLPQGILNTPLFPQSDNIEISIEQTEQNISNNLELSNGTYAVFLFKDQLGQQTYQTLEKEALSSNNINLQLTYCTIERNERTNTNLIECPELTCFPKPKERIITKKNFFKKIVKKFLGYSDYSEIHSNYRLLFSSDAPSLDSHNKDNDDPSSFFQRLSWLYERTCDGNILNNFFKLITEFPFGVIEEFCLWHFIQCRKMSSKSKTSWLKKAGRIIATGIIGTPLILTVPLYIASKIIRVGILRPIFSPKNSFDDAIDKGGKRLACLSVCMTTLGWLGIIAATTLCSLAILPAAGVVLPPAIQSSFIGPIINSINLATAINGICFSALTALGLAPDGINTFCKTLKNRWGKRENPILLYPEYPIDNTRTPLTYKELNTVFGQNTVPDDSDSPEDAAITTRKKPTDVPLLSLPPKPSPS